MDDCNEGVWVWVLDVSAHISPQYRSGEQCCECLVGHNCFVVCLPPPSSLLHRNGFVKSAEQVMLVIGDTAPSLATLTLSTCYGCVHNQCMSAVLIVQH